MCTVFQEAAQRWTLGLERWTKGDEHISREQDSMKGGIMWKTGGRSAFFLSFELILNLQTSCKNSKKSSLAYLNFISLVVNILHDNVQEINTGTVLLMRLQISFKIPIFPLVFFLLQDPIQDPILHLAAIPR